MYNFILKKGESKKPNSPSKKSKLSTAKASPTKTRSAQKKDGPIVEPNADSVSKIKPKKLEFEDATVIETEVQDSPRKLLMARHLSQNYTIPDPELKRDASNRAFLYRIFKL